jgi:catecholate siderophore receptor
MAKMRNRNNRRHARTIGPLLVTTALTTMTGAPAFAQDSLVAQATPANNQRDFDIAPQPLAAALALFGQQSGFRIAADAELVRDASTRGVQGRLPVEQALRRLLEGTGLTYAAPVGTTVALHKGTDVATQLAPIQVIGQRTPDANPYADPAAPYKVDRLSSAKFTEPVLNTPRSVTVLTKEVLDDQKSTTLREIGRSTAGVTLGTGEGGNAFGDRFFIRGFDARNDIFVDGVRDPGVSIRENYNTEQVEILRGPASSFAGRGTSGGAINIVTKQATTADFYKADATYGITDHTKRATFDVNQVIAPGLLDARVTGMVQNAGVAGRYSTTDNRRGIAGALLFTPTDRIKVVADYSFTHLYGLPDFGVPYNQLAKRPVTDGDVPRGQYYGIVNRDFTKTNQALGTLDAEWRVNDWMTVENKVRQSHSLLNYIGTIPENPSATGATAPFSSSATRFSGYTQLNAQSRYEPVSVLLDNPQAIFKFDTGPIRHAAVAGGEFSREKIGIDSYTGFTSELTTGPVAFTSTGAPIVSVYNPTNTLFGTGTAHLTGNAQKYNVNTSAGYLIDTANYDDFILVNGGVRYDDYRISSKNNTSSRFAESGLTSYNVGLVVKPTPASSVFLAYATASEPVGDELDAAASAYGGLAPTQNAAQIFGPQRSRAAELGTKWELFDRHMLATASLFQTKVDNARETAPANLPGYTSGQIVAGAAYRVQGLDFELAGKITDRWSVLGGLVLMKTQITKSVVPTNIGLQLANIAHQSFNLLTKYRVADWLEFGGQGIYASQIKGGSLFAANGGAAYPNPPNPTILPSHWRFDLFSEVKVNAHTTLKVYAQNILDKTYYDSFYQSAQPFVIVAPGRSVSVAAAVKF